jgi:hypothetical protein
MGEKPTRPKIFGRKLRDIHDTNKRLVLRVDVDNIANIAKQAIYKMGKNTIARLS